MGRKEAKPTSLSQIVITDQWNLGETLFQANIRVKETGGSSLAGNGLVFTKKGELASRANTGY